MLATKVGEILTPAYQRVGRAEPHNSQSTYLYADGCLPESPPPRFPHCMECPLPTCRYDSDGTFQNWKRLQKRRQALNLLQWLTPEQVAQILSLRPSTVRGIQQRGPIDENGEPMYCKNGHLWKENFTWVRRKKDGKMRWHRECVECRRLGANASYWKKKGAT